MTVSDNSIVVDVADTVNDIVSDVPAGDVLPVGDITDIASDIATEVANNVTADMLPAEVFEELIESINLLNDNVVILLTRLNQCFDFLLTFIIVFLICFIAYKLLKFFV